MELAHQMKDLPADVGVDIVLFDGEEFVWQQGRDDYFLGSTFFAEKYQGLTAGDSLSGRHPAWT